MPEHLAQSIEMIAWLRDRSEGKIGGHQRAVEGFTRRLGRPLSLYIILVLVSCWVAGNLVSPHLGALALDPAPFFWMQGAVALAALLMTTVVLITQNRQGRHAEQRSHLDLQVNLLAEQKIAKLIALVEELRRDLPQVRDRVDPVAEAMKESVEPALIASILQGPESGHTLTPSPPGTAGAHRGNP